MLLPMVKHLKNAPLSAKGNTIAVVLEIQQFLMSQLKSALLQAEVRRRKTANPTKVKG